MIRGLREIGELPQHGVDVDVLSTAIAPGLAIGSRFTSYRFSLWLVRPRPDAPGRIHTGGNTMSVHTAATSRGFARRFATTFALGFGLLLAAFSAQAGNLLLTGHDADFH